MSEENNQVIDPFTIDQDEFSTEEEINRNEMMKQVSVLIQAHNDLMSQIGVENLIERMIEIIDNAGSFQFKSDRSREIDKELPLFVMSLRKEVYSDYADLNASIFESSIITLVQREVIKPTGEILNEYIESNQEYFDEFGSKYGIDTKNMLMSNIFGVIIGNYKENNIQLRIFV